MQGVLKLFALNLVLTHLVNFFIVNKRIRLAPFLQVKVSVVNSAGSSFCWNYATDTFYGNYPCDMSVAFMQVLRWYFLLLVC